MAAPSEKTINDLTGKWVLNKHLSDSSDPVLALQGIGYLTRKGIGLAGITLDIKQYAAPPKTPNTSTDDVTHIEITQTPSGLKSTQETRCLDNIFREHSDGLFGPVKARTAWVTLDDIGDDFLKKDWLAEGEGKFIRGQVESEKDGWKVTQIWGFEMVNSERRYCRHLVATKGGKRAEVRFVYDFVA